MCSKLRVARLLPAAACLLASVVLTPLETAAAPIAVPVEQLPPCTAATPFPDLSASGGNWPFETPAEDLPPLLRQFVIVGFWENTSGTPERIVVVKIDRNSAVRYRMWGAGLSAPPGAPGPVTATVVGNDTIQWSTAQGTYTYTMAPDGRSINASGPFGSYTLTPCDWR